MIATLQVLTFVAIALNGLDIDFAGIHLNSERALMPLILLGLTGHVLANRPIFFSAPSWVYLAWVGSVVLSLILAINPAMHINGLIISIAPFFYFLLFMQRGLSQRHMTVLVEIFLWILSVASIVVFVIWERSGMFSTMIDRGRIALTMVEPNILGATLAALMVMHLGAARMGVRTILVQAVSLGALVLTASKMPYAAYLAAMFYLLFRSGILRRGAGLMIAMIGIIGLFAIIVLFADSFQTFYQTMLDRQDAINARVFTLTIAWERFLQHPFFGNGPLDFSFVNPEILERLGTKDKRDLWIGQIWIAVLHDEGVFGFTIFIAFLLATWVRCERLIRFGERQFMGYMAAVIAVLAGSQATTVHLTAIFGLAFGLANSKPEGVAAFRSAMGRRRPTAAPWAMERG